MKTKRAWQVSLLITLLSSNFFLFSNGANAYNADTWTDAGQTYQKICGHCHETGVGPVIKGRGLPADFIMKMVRHGNRAMPAFRRSDINNQTLKELAELIGNSKSTDKLMASSKVADK